MIFADPSLPHQIVLRFRPLQDRATMGIAVTCNCGAELACRACWDDPREPMRIWREHMAALP